LENNNNNNNCHFLEKEFQFFLKKNSPNFYTWFQIAYIYIVNNQIWLNWLMVYHQLSYITKLKNVGPKGKESELTKCEKHKFSVCAAC
jgi:hypothetical protein